jgi:alpha-tubulin suppressor-like RCC1 family protein
VYPDPFWARSTFAIRADGTLWRWGNGGIGGTLDSNYGTAPAQVGTDNNWAVLSRELVLGIRTDGTLWDISATPVRIGTDNGWVRVAGPSDFSGNGTWDHCLAIRSDGTLWAKGDNSRGQLGVGLAVPNSAEFVRVGTDNDWADVVVGEYGSEAIKADGTYWTWGGEYPDPAEDPSSPYYLRIRDTPVREGDYRLRRHAIGMDIRTDGTLWTTVYPESGPPDYVQVGTASDWTDVAPGMDHVVARRADGTVWVWGSNASGQLGLGGYPPEKYAPVRIGTDADWEIVSAGEDSSLGIKSDGSLWYWGKKGSAGSDVPVRVGLDRWKTASAADIDTAFFAIRMDGTLWFTSTYGDSMTQVGADSDWTSVAGGLYQCMAIKADGSLWSISHLTAEPFRVGTASWRDISIGFNEQTYTGIQADGSLWGWGVNDFGQVGDGTKSRAYTPVRIRTDNTWTSVSRGTISSFARRGDGTIWGWGCNSVCELGDGTITDRLVPGQIGARTDWAGVFGSSGDAMAIRNDGTLWGWGYNYSGLIDATRTTQPFPKQIGTAGNWKTVALGRWHALGLRTDGSLWAWGFNFFGCLGDGSVQKLEPTRLH